MSQRSIEAKVGALILMALALLAGFIVVMGGLSLEPTLTVYVDFENPGALQAGAPVRLAGMQIGRVSEVRFRGGEVDPTTQEAVPPIRVVARIEQKYQKALRANARWFVTSSDFVTGVCARHSRPTAGEPSRVRRSGSIRSSSRANWAWPARPRTRSTARRPATWWRSSRSSRR